MKRRWLIAVALFLVLMQTGLEARTVKIGCLYPLTGPGGLYGRDSVVAIRMAQRHIESLQREGYPKLEVIIEDSRSRVLRSLQIARRFIEEEKVDFLCGVVSSRVALMVTELAKKNRTFFIGTDHASPQLVSSHWNDYYFRASNDVGLSMFAGARYIKENYGGTGAVLKIAFIGPDYEYGYHSWDALRQFLKANDVKFTIVGEFWPRLFETDFSTYIRALMQTRADIIINAHWGQDLVTFINQARQGELFSTSQFMNFDTGGNYEVLAELGSNMPLGLVLSSRHHVNWPPTDANEKFVADFFEEAGRYPSYAAEGAYAGILVIAEAVRRAGGLESDERLREALRSLRLSLPEDPEGFSSYIDPNRHQIMQVQAIGKTVVNDHFPPATVLLGDWSVYPPPAVWPNVAGDVDK